MLSSEDWNKVSKSALIPPCGTALGLLAGAIRQEGAIKGIRTRKNGVKPPLFADGTIVYIKIPEILPKR